MGDTFALKILILFIFLNIFSNVSTKSSSIKTFSYRYILGDCNAGKDFFQVNYDQMEEPDLKKLQLVLFTKTEKSAFYMNHTSAIPTFRTFDPSLPVVIYIPGYMDVGSFIPIMSTLVEHRNVNVIGLDILNYSFQNYLKITVTARYIGKSLGRALADMNKKGVDKVHLIGVSLGAQIAGFAGKEYEEITGEKLDRITGLDPAGPCFYSEPDELRLSNTDATFVDIIHTDKNVIGIGKLIGTANFFPNGGTNQPDCTGLWCDHARSWLFFIETIVNGKSYPAVRCESYEKFLRGDCVDRERAFMGYDVSRNASGDYYLLTRGWPSTLGQIWKAKYLPLRMVRSWYFQSPFNNILTRTAIRAMKVDPDRKKPRFEAYKFLP